MVLFITFCYLCEVLGDELNTISEFLPFISIGSTITSCFFSLSNSVLMHKKESIRKKGSEGFSQGLAKSLINERNSKLRGKVILEDKDQILGFSNINISMSIGDSKNILNTTESIDDFNENVNIKMINDSNILKSNIDLQDHNATDLNGTSKINFLKLSDNFMYGLDCDVKRSDETS